MRVGLLQKGGFLHSGFDAVTAADSSINHDFTYAKYVCDELGYIYIILVLSIWLPDWCNTL